MGLDITYYSKIAKVSREEAFDSDGELKWENGERYLQPNKNPHFPGRADDITNNAPYKYEECDCFYAGSYGGYGWWRNELAKLAGWPEEEYSDCGETRKSYALSVWNNPIDGPFMELINFSDCEGVIGAEVSKKLAKDFAEHQERANNHNNERFRTRYQQWRTAFEVASESGCVEFH